ncbi:hypothetical protein J3A83DRAFT_2576398 [Scleroderma citrinum]
MALKGISTSMNTSLASASTGPSGSTSTAPSTYAGHGHSTMPPELEQTLSMLSAHRSVLGYMLLSRGEQVSIIRHSGVVFEGEQGKRYAAVIRRIVESVQAGLEEVSGEENEGDSIRFMRIRTKRHELMISPDNRYLLAVLHDPAA